MISNLPTLLIMEGLAKWGEVRLRPDNLENVTYVELKRSGAEEGWKPLFAFTALAGRIAFRLMAEKAERVVVYDSVAGTFSDLHHTPKVGDGSSVRDSKVGKDDDSRGNDS